jgi:hypothetical protein
VIEVEVEVGVRMGMGSVEEVEVAGMFDSPPGRDVEPDPEVVVLFSPAKARR